MEELAGMEINAEEFAEFPEGFEDFYNRFLSDPSYQLAHIAFPLPKVTNDALPGETWTSENWIQHKPYDDYNGSFERSFRTVGPLVQESVKEVNGLFAMERRYGNLVDGWNLIYYSALSPESDVQEAAEELIDEQE